MAVETFPDRAVVYDERVQGVSSTRSFMRPVSWQAILAGVAVALIVQLALNVLGLTIGASTFDPLYDQDPLTLEFETGTVIWLAASAIISLFAGGVVAGRMAGMVDPIDGALHGVVTWAVVTIVSILLLTTVTGRILSAASNLISSGVNLAGTTVEEVAPAAADALELQDIRLQAVQEEARELLGIQQSEINEAEATLENTAESIANNPTAIERELDLMVASLLNGDDDLDRDRLETFLVNEGGLTEQEAQETVTNWEQTYDEIRVETEETVREVGQQLTDAIAIVAGLIFMVLVLGAFAAGAGGIIGSPEELPVAVSQSRTEVIS